jgi:hypothetical protein
MMRKSTVEDLAKEIESAFQDVTYPGDDNLVYDNSGRYWDVREAAQAFKSQHWKTIPLKVIVSNRDHLPFLTPAAFHFFLPAFLLASLLHPVEADTLNDNLIYLLTPPDETDRRKNWLLSIANKSSSEQKAVIIAFMKFKMEEEPAMYEDDAKVAIEFWKTA